MAYSELIKDFNRIRDYMRQFYVYGFKTRDEYDAKSARSYDNERRRIESWLGEYMSFRQEPSGKVSFISVDCGEIVSNPLYNAFKAKSFTANDIVLHFCVLDILQPGVRLGVSEITELIDGEYMSAFEEPKVFDEATVRNKLNEYAKAGILDVEKAGRKNLYSRSEDTVSLDAWREAIAFYSEADPAGVIGSFLQDRMDTSPDWFRFKHHYILHALESDIICTLLDAAADSCTALISVGGKTGGKGKAAPREYKTIPFQIALSTENGRGYLLAWDTGEERFYMHRLDRIQSVKKGVSAEKKAELEEAAKEFASHLWNTSGRGAAGLDHLEMILRIEPREGYILSRLEREGKHGRVEKAGQDLYRFSIDVYDAGEMIPWLRTFIGRIEKLTCTNSYVERLFYEDLQALYEMYMKDGGWSDAV